MYCNIPYVVVLIKLIKKWAASVSLCSRALACYPPESLVMAVHVMCYALHPSMTARHPRQQTARRSPHCAAFHSLGLICVIITRPSVSAVYPARICVALLYSIRDSAERARLDPGVDASHVNLVYFDANGFIEAHDNAYKALSTYSVRVTLPCCSSVVHQRLDVCGGCCASHMPRLARRCAD